MGFERKELTRNLETIKACILNETANDFRQHSKFMFGLVKLLIDALCSVVRVFVRNCCCTVVKVISNCGFLLNSLRNVETYTFCEFSPFFGNIYRSSSDVMVPSRNFLLQWPWLCCKISIVCFSSTSVASETDDEPFHSSRSPEKFEGSVIKLLQVLYLLTSRCCYLSLHLTASALESVGRRIFR